MPRAAVAVRQSRDRGPLAQVAAGQEVGPVSSVVHARKQQEVGPLPEEIECPDFGAQYLYWFGYVPVHPVAAVNVADGGRLRSVHEEEVRQSAVAQHRVSPYAAGNAETFAQ